MLHIHAFLPLCCTCVVTHSCSAVYDCSQLNVCHQNFAAASETYSCRYLHKVARDPLLALTNDKNRAPAREHSWYGGNQHLNMTFKYIVDTIINIKCVSKRNRKNDKTTASARGGKQPGRFAPYHTPSLYASSLSPCAAECMQVGGSAWMDRCALLC